MKKLGAFVTIISLLFMYMQIPASATETVNYRTGLIMDSYEEISAHLETTSTYATLPDSVDNTSKFPAPGDQGQQGSCVGWAVGYAMKSGLERRKRGWTVSSDNHKFSPAYIYNKISNGTDGGASVLDALELMETQGACTWTYFPYNQNNYTKQPTSLQTANANLYKVSEYHTILGVQTIKEKIYQNYGVVIGIEVYPDFDNLTSSNSIYDTTLGTSRGGHAICLIGYDDTKGENGAFKFINSWGTDWGINGYGWIAYETVADACPTLHLPIGYYAKTTADTYKMGDPNSDGVISTADVQMALKGADDATSLTSAQFVLADVDGDAVLSQEDATEILRVAAGQATTFSLYT